MVVMVVVAVNVAVDTATVVVEADETDPAGPKVPMRDVEPKPPETTTRAKAKRTPATSPIPKRFPSIIEHTPLVGR